MNQTIEHSLPTLVPVLKRRIKAYHDMFSLPLIGEFWEETLHRSFEEIGFKTTWTPDRSHTVGEDMRLIDVDSSRISCKSGQISNNRKLRKECVKFSGSRSTKFETLEEKIAYFSESHDDCYFLLAKNKPFNKKYRLMIFNSSLCDVSKLEWSETSSGKEWKGEGEFLAIIGKSMSAQLWTTIPIENIDFICEIDCNTYDKTPELLPKVQPNIEPLNLI